MRPIILYIYHIFSSRIFILSINLGYLLISFHLRYIYHIYPSSIYILSFHLGYISYLAIQDIYHIYILYQSWISIRIFSSRIYIISVNLGYLIYLYIQDIYHIFILSRISSYLSIHHEYQAYRPSRIFIIFLSRLSILSISFSPILSNTLEDIYLYRMHLSYLIISRINILLFIFPSRINLGSINFKYTYVYIQDLYPVSPLRISITIQDIYINYTSWISIQLGKISYPFIVQLYLADFSIQDS